MYRVTPGLPLPLFDTPATRRMEVAAAAGLPPHTLMRRAGLAVARLALALAPHARTVWIACGPGNNGGDGMEAAMHLQRWGVNVVITWLGDEESAPADACASLSRAREAGATFSGSPPDDLRSGDLCIDALLGIGTTRAPQGRMAEWIATLNASLAPILAVDLPTGMNADTGNSSSILIADHDHSTLGNGQIYAKNTLTLLSCKPGLFTARGRDTAGTVWFDDLGVKNLGETPCASLNAAPADTHWNHASHKGSRGDVAVIGGEGLGARGMGMSGAALLAASGALHAGAGRVLVNLLDSSPLSLDATQPELMFRSFEALDLRKLTVICGCGGGDAVRAVLPKVTSQAFQLVLDADALNAIATDISLRTLLRQRAARGLVTVLTPHPLEAARLLDSTVAKVQADRLAAARQLSNEMQCVAVLKGSGTVIAAPGEVTVINATGNARLGTAGTGDVLAGLVGARLANGIPVFAAACSSTYQHGAVADAWPADQALTASALARRLNA